VKTSTNGILPQSPSPYIYLSLNRSHITKPLQLPLQPRMTNTPVAVGNAKAMGKSICLISQIDSSVTLWSIRAKVIRLCEVIDFDIANALPSIEMVLMDLKGGRIHATIPNSLTFKFKSRVAEGKTYVFKKLSVKINSGNIRTTSHPYKLVFEACSSLSVVDNSKITQSPYDLVPISDMVARRFDPSIMIGEFRVYKKLS
jgi:hypothetical protein